jgi:Ras-related protein Rab-9B
MNDFSFILVGNKINKSERKISKKEAQEWCNKNENVKYFETCAFNYNSIQDLFIFIVKQTLKEYLKKSLFH